VTNETILSPYIITKKGEDNIEKEKKKNSFICLNSSNVTCLPAKFLIALKALVWLNRNKIKIE